MELYFNVAIEFDAGKVDEAIQTSIREGGKGYVCSIESNNLTIANRNPRFREVVNGALVNICDGSVLAWLFGEIYHKPYKPYIGADLFIHYISMGIYKQYYLGNTFEVLSGLRTTMSKLDPKVSGMCFEELPFLPVTDFDYKGIAAKINQDNPDIIWVSLGAPKQEEFMSRLLPYLNRGVMFGFGAIFNFYAGTGSVKRAPFWMRRLRLEWLYRAFEEPKKNVPRYAQFIKLLPRLLKNEYQTKKNRGSKA